MIHLKETLDTFFKSNNNVIVIKGDWGVGKTYFWEKYYQTKKGNINKAAYSYISLFG
ncbi:hypothetical protein ABM70_004528, partial [Salmonella enterica subsp. enterica serovar Weltevreden]|nr:hypothetical protein [Salmonella enterica subsp. enterica serovar Weltevreden]